MGFVEESRRRAALPRHAHRPDLRGHQRHPGDGPRRPQAADAHGRRRSTTSSPGCARLDAELAAAGDELDVDRARNLAAAIDVARGRDELDHDQRPRRPEERPRRAPRPYLRDVRHRHRRLAPRRARRSPRRRELAGGSSDDGVPAGEDHHRPLLRGAAPARRPPAWSRRCRPAASVLYEVDADASPRCDGLAMAGRPTLSEPAVRLVRATGSLAAHMLDHVFTDAIGALRDALEKALLERQAFEERFQTDVLLGDLTWETSYSPARRGPAAAGPLRHHPRVADLVADRLPLLVHRGGVRRAARASRSRWCCASSAWRPGRPEARVLDVLPTESPADRRRDAAPVRARRSRRPTATTSTEIEHAIEVVLRGQLRARRGDPGGRLGARRPLLGDGRLDRSTLVRLGDLKMEFLPPLEKDED